ncbi:hypothetical protein M569_14624, partial [Genlisea aurea]
LTRLLASLCWPPNPPLPSPQPNWFERFRSSSPDHDPKWTDFFNLSKSNFTHLLRFLAPFLHSALHPLPPDVALASTLFRLSHAASFASISRRFSLDAPTACRAFYSVCRAVIENLGHLFELGSDMNRVIAGFGWISLPNCCGVLGVENFDIESSNSGSSSLSVQALVDSEGRFLDISAGWPGNCRPHQILKRSKLFYGIVDSKQHLNGPGFELNKSETIPQYILGDCCYPLLDFLLTPFCKNKGLVGGSSEMGFNRVHKKGMNLLSRAFRNLKKRWKLVGKKWREEEECMEAFPFVIVASCLLHNFVIKCSE